MSWLGSQAVVSSNPNMGPMSTAPGKYTGARGRYALPRDHEARSPRPPYLRRPPRGGPGRRRRGTGRRGRARGLERPGRRSTRSRPTLLLRRHPAAAVPADHARSSCCPGVIKGERFTPGGQATAGPVVRRPGQGHRRAAGAGQRRVQGGWSKWPLVSSTRRAVPGRRGDPPGRADLALRVQRLRRSGRRRAACVRDPAPQLAGRPVAQHPDHGRPRRAGARDRHRRPSCAATSPTRRSS